LENNEKADGGQTMGNDNFGDWRIAVVTTLVNDLPAAFHGGPAHKAGTPVYLSSLTRDRQHNAIGFITPSSTALALNAALRSALRAKNLRNTLALTDTLTPLGSGKQVANENLPHLYDFFEHCMIAVTCSFQSIEMFCNEIIAQNPQSSFRLVRGKEVLTLSGEELERRASTEEKVADLLPLFLGLKCPKGTKLWERFQDLKTARDSTIHCKSKEMRTDITVDRESLFFQFFRREPTEFPAIAFEVIEYFHKEAKLPRWAITAKKRIDSAKNGLTGDA
jgi:hypothetical protein